MFTVSAEMQVGLHVKFPLFFCPILTRTAMWWQTFSELQTWWNWGMFIQLTLFFKCSFSRTKKLSHLTCQVSEISCVHWHERKF